MNYLIFFGIICFWANCFGGLIRCFHMLQQNSYKAERYVRFGKTAAKGRWVLTLLSGLMGTMLLWMWHWGFVLFGGLTAAIRIWHSVKEQKKAIKPLVWTPRVKRMAVTGCLIAIVDCGLFFISQTAEMISAGIAVFFAAVTPVLALLILLINTPVEGMISRHYIQDAKRILRNSPDMKIIGVTGSYGKTGTKFMITRLLEEKYQVTVTPESFNTPMGIVRTIREKMKPGTQIFVVEMGAKQKGDIREICDIVHPNYGVITSIGPQHLDTFHTLETIISTKFELADAVEAAGGTMFLNYDSEPVTYRACKQAICYGTDGSFPYYAANIQYDALGASFTVYANGEAIPLRTRLLGQHNIINLTAAVAVARYFDVAIEEIQFAVRQLQPTPHRLEVKSFTGGSTVIDDAYNANPAGCLEAVNVLGRFQNKKKIIVTPGLVELGEREYQCNFDLGVRAGQVCDEIVLVGLKRSEPIAKGVRSTGFAEERLHVVASFQEAMSLLSPTLDETCVVLLENDLPDNYLY